MPTERPSDYSFVTFLGEYREKPDGLWASEATSDVESNFVIPDLRHDRDSPFDQFGNSSSFVQSALDFEQQLAQDQGDIFENVIGD